ncbi:Na/Pi cotransporter family protein [Candidatus Bathyarchaeota archaeon]|jgi:solute carrier family 34 (sodium-dependent phosphate cotransporter)|nr:Na/Pi cotransporter family protein [Candidatus Bathyarchaeota archaeon]MBT4319750.1 Na/Pi cotransporter family protein [Candidatus Bathyarchaeota archaeon]MBT4424977.1 Na/Pi cotransporter family protein [Candidatus Bathyarchaeota archaeon]MBT5642567.1 Na/Pi cotransporter family protein [Candidatus Bathyarchaeota archaeon]MBT6603906.1 Na/Pi cotransporter family protein [Candidatus Bathyarchaeota archaeon]
MANQKNKWHSRIPIISNDRARLIITLALSIYFFISSLEGVKHGFKLIFTEWQGSILAMITGNTAAITGLALGMLSTALVQSSSAVVAATMVSMSGMVASGLPMETAIQFGVPMVLGANIGTTVTNTIVAFGIERGMTMKEFKHTIPGVIVDDVYEGLTIAIFFTLELTTGLISKIVLRLGDFYTEVLQMETIFASFENTVIDIIIEEPIIKPMKNFVVGYLGTLGGGVFMFIFWFLVIIFSMGLITKGLEKLIETGWEEKVKAAFESPAKGFLTGFTITFIVGSSSIGSSLVIPFLATRVVNLKTAYPYLVGCNLATAVDMSQIYGYIAGGTVGMVLGSAHVLLNLMAITLWFISPLRFVPIRVAEVLGEMITENENAIYSLFAWVIAVFFAIPIGIIYIL